MFIVHTDFIETLDPDPVNQTKTDPDLILRKAEYYLTINLKKAISDQNIQTCRILPKYLIMAGFRSKR